MVNVGYRSSLGPEQGDRCPTRDITPVSHEVSLRYVVFLVTAAYCLSIELDLFLNPCSATSQLWANYTLFLSQHSYL